MADKVKPYWDRYAKDCRAAGANDAQVEDLRLAFYSGATIVFGLIDRLFNDERTTGEDAANLRDDLFDELVAFGELARKTHGEPIDEGKGSSGLH